MLLPARFRNVTTRAALVLPALGPSRADLKEKQGDFKYPGVDDSWDKGMIHLRYECHRVSSSDAGAPPLQ
eukprot:COSAG01_NODE_565_length_15436_cov_64.116581_21_plen_70_part_00